MSLFSINKLQCFLYKLLNKVLVTFRDIFDHFCEKIYQPLIKGNGGQGYDCLWDLFFRFKEALNSIKPESVILNTQVYSCG